MRFEDISTLNIYEDDNFYYYRAKHLNISIKIEKKFIYYLKPKDYIQKISDFGSSKKKIRGEIETDWVWDWVNIPDCRNYILGVEDYGVSPRYYTKNYAEKHFLNYKTKSVNVCKSTKNKLILTFDRVDYNGAFRIFDEHMQGTSHEFLCNNSVYEDLIELYLKSWEKGVIAIELAEEDYLKIKYKRMVLSDK